MQAAVDVPVGAAYRAIRTPRSNGMRPRLSFRDQGKLVPSVQHEEEEESSSKHAIVVSTDLARRAQTRVMEHHRVEVEKKQEQDEMRRKKVAAEQDKRAHEVLVKQHRRAEIYAVNAILRKLLQEKMSQCLALQQV